MPPSDPDPAVSFHRVPSALNRARVEEFAVKLKQGPAKRVPFHCLLTTDTQLQQLNRHFLGKDYATDVLSFPESGDIAISYPRARVQAKEFGHSVEEEISILMLHGVLHLAGMDHETDGGAMARTEAVWRKKLGLPLGLIARTHQRKVPV
jgi:probable rRNA maturation factor